jgi:hypothetical protein
MEMDGELEYRVAEATADPMIFRPSVDFEKLTDPSIIHAF